MKKIYLHKRVDSFDFAIKNTILLFCIENLLLNSFTISGSINSPILFLLNLVLLNIFKKYIEKSTHTAL